MYVFVNLVFLFDVTERAMIPSVHNAPMSVTSYLTVPSPLTHTHFHNRHVSMFEVLLSLSLPR